MRTLATRLGFVVLIAVVGASLPPATSPALAVVAAPAARASSADIGASYHGVWLPPGTYLLWKKSKNLVLMVRHGKVIRAMPTTDLDWKTPVGDYHIWYKQSRTYSFDDVGRRVELDYFLPFVVGPGGGNIGFHMVPYYGSRGHWIQPLSTVGKDGYSSHGCLRLRPDDAYAVWLFAQPGTIVKVR